MLLATTVLARTMPPMYKLGGHVSAAGGIDKAVVRAAEIGGNAVQIFSMSPRMWRPRVISETEKQAFREAMTDHKVVASVIHAIYLINLASEKPEIIEKSKTVLISDLKLCGELGMDGVVVHLGSHLGNGYEAVSEAMISTLSEILAATPENSKLLIENSAGQKGKLPGSLEELSKILSHFDPTRVGWCVDTCHAHAAGYPLTSEGEQLGILDQAEQLGILSRLGCVHINDSRDEFDSHRDRHANLGQGLVDPGQFMAFIKDPRIASLPMLMEVPGLDNNGPDKPNLDTLKSMLGVK